MTDQLFIFENARRFVPEVEGWFDDRPGDIGGLARQWFNVMRDCGEDVQELLHDHHPTACVNNAAFAYVNAFKAHVNVGFFRGAELDDPRDLLEGNGRFMRHVKVRPGERMDEKGLHALVRTAYQDMQSRVEQ